MACLALVTTFARDAAAIGTFKLKSNEATEVSGAWHIYVTHRAAEGAAHGPPDDEVQLHEDDGLRARRSSTATPSRS